MKELYTKIAGKNIKIFTFIKDVSKLEYILKNYKIEVTTKKPKNEIDLNITLINKISKLNSLDINKAIKASNILIINTRCNTSFNLSDIYTLSYGLDNKASVTLSSFNDNDDIILCIQREIYNVFHEQIEPTEIKEKNYSNLDIKIEELLGILTLKIILTKK